MHGLVELISQTREILIGTNNRDAGPPLLVSNGHEAKRAHQTFFPESIALYDGNRAKFLSQSLI